MIASRKFLIALLSLFVLALFAPVEAQSNDNEAATRDCHNRAKEIDVELAGTKINPWMGKYQAYMRSFTLAPTSGFFFFRGSDYVYSSCAWGRVEWVDGKIKLKPDAETPPEGLRGMDLEWFPVAWGDRHYLIASNDVLSFVNAVNNGYEPSYRFPGLGGMYYKRVDDEDRKVIGFPDVPAAFREYFLSKPIRGRITAIRPFEIETEDNGNVHTRVTKVSVNVGAKHGVKVGMNFITYEPRRVHENVVITNVAEDSSEAVIRQSGIIYQSPSIKWRVSTSRNDIK